jgi:gas vesicle protein
MLGIGMVIGTVIGAGIALLVAPQSGLDTRRGFSKRVNRFRGRSRVWTRLGRELKRAAAAKQKAMQIEAKREEIRNRATTAVT